MAKISSFYRFYILSKLAALWEHVKVYSHTELAADRALNNTAALELFRI